MAEPKWRVTLFLQPKFSASPAPWLRGHRALRKRTSVRTHCLRARSADAPYVVPRPLRSDALHHLSRHAHMHDWLPSRPGALHAESFTPTRRFERRSSLFAVRSGNTRCAQYLRPAHRSSHSLTACFACFLHAACFAAWTTTRHTNPVLTITRCWCAPRAAHGTCELVGRMCLCSSEPFGRVILLVVAARARPHLRFRKTLKAHSVLRACLLDALVRRI